MRSHLFLREWMSMKMVLLISKSHQTISHPHVSVFFPKITLFYFHTVYTVCGLCDCVCVGWPLCVHIHRVFQQKPCTFTTFSTKILKHIPRSQPKIVYHNRLPRLCPLHILHTNTNSIYCNMWYIRAAKSYAVIYHVPISKHVIFWIKRLPLLCPLHVLPTRAFLMLSLQRPLVVLPNHTSEVSVFVVCCSVCCSVWCSVLQGVVVCYSVLPLAVLPTHTSEVGVFAMRCNVSCSVCCIVLQCVLQCVAVWQPIRRPTSSHFWIECFCSVLQYLLQYVLRHALQCVLQCVVMCCSLLKCVATCHPTYPHQNRLFVKCDSSRVRISQQWLLERFG